MSCNKTIYIKTFGCQMNDRDSEALLGLFLAKGYKVSFNSLKADVVLVNTCSVRALAENKARSFLGELQILPVIRKRIKSTKNKKIVGLIGCMARNEGKRLFQKMAHLGLICAPGCLERIPGYVEDIFSGKRKRIIDLEDRMRDEAAYLAPFRNEVHHANVVISTGCANSCSYCIVPYVRGKLRLRSPKDILAEVKGAIKNGVSHITLLGQNVNDYKHKDADFIGLLKMVEAVNGIKEIDFVSSNPKNTSKELFTLMAKSSKMKKYINLPFQSGSDRILKAMDRGYTRDEYIKLVKDYKRIVGGQISTDIIVGFPGETDTDFQATRDVMDQCRFDFAFIFKYSVRPNSPAQNLADSVPKSVKEKRHKELLELQKKISNA